MAKVVWLLGVVVVALGVAFGLLQLVTPFQPPICSWSQGTIGCLPQRFGGSVEKGFEPIEQMFRQRFADGLELGAQLAIYYKGKQVVNLWGGSHSDTSKPFDQDSLINVFSSGKLLECLTIAKLVEEGLLDYNEKVAHYWPEFAANGKGSITLREVMQHSAGLTYDLEFEAPEVWDQDAQAALIAKESPNFSNHTRRAYHAITRGYILNEIVRRVDPKHRSIGEFVRDAMKDAFPDRDPAPEWYTPNLMPKDRWPQVSRWVSAGGLHTIKAIVLPLLAQKVVQLVFPEVRLVSFTLDLMAKSGADPNSLFIRTVKVLRHRLDDVNNIYKYNATEMTSSNTISNANTLALVAAAFSQQFPNKLLSAKGYELAMANPKAEFDEVLGRLTVHPDGGVISHADFGSQDLWWGGAGYGGSLSAWHSKLDVALGYSCNGFHLEPPSEVLDFVAKFFAEKKV